MLTELADPDLLAVLADTHVATYRAQAFYGEDLSLPDGVPLAGEGSIRFDADAQIQTSGTAYVARDALGETSLVPRLKTDPLAPYGQEITIDRIIRSGENEWAIPLGRFPIAGIPDMREHFARVGSGAELERRLLAYELQLKLRDRFEWIRGADFLRPEAPRAGFSTWEEIQRISPIPIVGSLPDQTIPASLAYTDSRYDAIVTLMDNLGGEPHLLRDGSLTARVKDAWLTETVPVFEITGTIDVSEDMSADDVYNAVRVRASVGDNLILGIAQITAEHPLKVGGPFNGGAAKVYGYGSPLIVDQSMADATATTILARVSTQHARRVKIVTLPNPLLELGDYGTAIDYRTGRSYSGSIASMDFSLNPLDDMVVELIVAEETD